MGIKYSTGKQNIITDSFQLIRLSEGYCPHRCPWCYEWKECKVKHDFPIPQIVRRDVRISDMNLLASPMALWQINSFESIRVNNQVVYPHLICGIDYRLLTDEIAEALKKSRFQKIHIAWDGKYLDQRKVKTALKLLEFYGHRDISIFMICNHSEISYDECINKLNLCKYWNVKVNDCWFDNQRSPNIKPIAWTLEQIKDFRKQVRKHNQFVNFGIDPELKC